MAKCIEDDLPLCIYCQIGSSYNCCLTIYREIIRYYLSHQTTSASLLKYWISRIGDNKQRAAKAIELESPELFERISKYISLI